MTSFLVPEPDLQIEFYRRLEAIRESWLIDALLSTVSKLEISQIDRELAEFVPPPAMQEVAGWGLRAEILFAVPCILENNPALLGYYRLLLGFSQKQFYGDRYGIRPFKSMEVTGQLSVANRADLKGLSNRPITAVLVWLRNRCSIRAYAVSRAMGAWPAIIAQKH